MRAERSELLVFNIYTGELRTIPVLKEGTELT